MISLVRLIFTGLRSSRRFATRFVDPSSVAEVADLLTKERLPLLLYCVADWSVHCKSMHSLLKEKLPNTIPNILALRIDISKFQNIAEDLQIRSVPTTFIIYKRDVMDRLVGLPDETKLKDFFKTAENLYNLDKSELEIESLMEAAMNEQDVKEGIDRLREIQKKHDLSTKYEGYFYALLADAYYKLGNIPESKEHLRKATEYYKTIPIDELAKKAISELTVKLESNDTTTKEEEAIEKLLAELDKTPENNEKRYEIALTLLKLGKYEECAKECLNILRIDRNWSQGKAKELLTKVLLIVGSSSELAISTRKQLSSILFT